MLATHVTASLRSCGRVHNSDSTLPHVPFTKPDAANDGEDNHAKSPGSVGVYPQAEQGGNHQTEEHPLFGRKR